MCWRPRVATGLRTEDVTLSPIQPGPSQGLWRLPEPEYGFKHKRGPSSSVSLASMRCFPNSTLIHVSFPLSHRGLCLKAQCLQAITTGSQVPDGPHKKHDALSLLRWDLDLPSPYRLVVPAAVLSWRTFVPGNQSSAFQDRGWDPGGERAPSELGSGRSRCSKGSERRAEIRTSRS